MARVGTGKSANDDDDDASMEEFSLDGSASFVGEEEKRNETEGLLLRVSQYTRRVHHSRVLVTLAILATAAVVAGVTYTSLSKEEMDMFETTVS